MSLSYDLHKQCANRVEILWWYGEVNDPGHLYVSFVEIPPEHMNQYNLELKKGPLAPVSYDLNSKLYIYYDTERFHSKTHHYHAEDSPRIREKLASDLNTDVYISEYIFTIGEILTLKSSKIKAKIINRNRDTQQYQLLINGSPSNWININELIQLTLK